MKENKMLIRIICTIALIITCNLFLGCDKGTNGEDCPTPTEFGLINLSIGDLGDVYLTYSWMDVSDAQEYIFTLRVNSQVVYTETLQDTLLSVSQPPLQDGAELAATVEAVCGDDILSAPNEVVFILATGIAAVETIYKTGEACDTYSCDHVKFDLNINQFCGDRIEHLKNHYYPKENFCFCETNHCSIREFADCLERMNTKRAGNSSEGC